MNSDINANNYFNLDILFELSPDFLCIAGFDGFFKKINPIVSQTLGYTTEELFSRPINSFVHPDDQGITAISRENLKKNKPLLNFQNRYVTKSGETVWLAWTSMPVESEQVVFAIAKNITHKKKLEDDRNTLLTDLTTINQDMKRLAYTISHDLRSPVSNLLTIFDLMDISEIKDEETLSFMDMLKSTTNSLKDTLNNYVDVLNQKQTASAMIEEVNISWCMSKILHSLKSLLKNSKAVISTDFAELEKVNFNKSYLESILLNLVTNAVKYAKPGVAPQIAVSTKYENGVKQLIFSDKGMGFDMEKVKNKVFGLNQKFHEHTDSKGIGLYLVHNHVTSMGAQIELQSKVNDGATFVITFKADENRQIAIADW